MLFDKNSGPAISQPRIQILSAFNGKASVLRLDEVHPVVSGNKWYKLKGYLEKAQTEGKHTIITFGGAYSNHIVATAAACAGLGLQSIGIIRGEAPPGLSPTLSEARSLGMKLHFTARTAYREKIIPPEVWTQVSKEDCLVIAEGGHGPLGVRGISTLAQGIALEPYSHILCAVGTGTTLAGFAQAAFPHQQVIGIAALKNNFSLEGSVKEVLPNGHAENFKVLHAYHFGGYAKHTPELLQFMNDWYRLTSIPSDFVYTAKLFYAFQQLWQEGFFSPSSHVLLVHSGGLQGNRSLTEGSLIF